MCLCSWYSNKCGSRTLSANCCSNTNRQFVVTAWYLFNNMYLKVPSSHWQCISRRHAHARIVNMACARFICLKYAQYSARIRRFNEVRPQRPKARVPALVGVIPMQLCCRRWGEGAYLVLWWMLERAWCTRGTGIGCASASYTVYWLQLLVHMYVCRNSSCLNHTSRMAIRTSTLMYPCRLSKCAHSIRTQLTEPRSSQRHLRKTDHRHYTQEITHDTVPCSERHDQKRDHGKGGW